MGAIGEDAISDLAAGMGWRRLRIMSGIRRTARLRAPRYGSRQNRGVSSIASRSNATAPSRSPVQQLKLPASETG